MRGGGVEQHRIAHRPAPPANTSRTTSALCGRVAAAQVAAGRTGAMPSAAGSIDVSAHRPPAPTQTRRGGRGGQLVQPVVAAEHQRRVAALGEHPGHHRRHPRSAQPIARRGRPGRVGQRAEEVEERRHAQLAARGPACRIDGWKTRREAEADADLGDACGHAAPAAGRSPRRAPRARRPTPHADDAARLPCLTTGAPARPPRARPSSRCSPCAPGRRRCRRCPPRGPGTVTRRGAVAASSAPARRARPASRPWPAAARRTPASWAGDASPAMISVHRPGGVVGVEIVPPSSVVSRPGQDCAATVGQPSPDDGDAACAGARSSSATDLGGLTGSSGCGPASRRPATRWPASASCGRRDEHHDRRAVVDLVLDLPASPMPPVGCASPSRIDDVQPPSSSWATTSAMRRALDPVDPPDVGRGTPADRRRDRARGPPAEWLYTKHGRTRSRPARTGDRTHGAGIAIGGPSVQPTRDTRDTTRSHPAGRRRRGRP